MKTFVICAKEEYNFLSGHLHKIIVNEDFIVPFEYENYTNIDNKLVKKALINSYGLKFDKALYLAKYNWYEKKFNHFKNSILNASKIIILENDLFAVDDFDIEEKRMEISYIHKLGYPTEKINMSNLIKQKKLKYPQN